MSDNPPIVIESAGNADPKDLAKKQALLASTEMDPVQGTVDLEIPTDVLWEAFTHANGWPRWNKCFFWAHNRDLVLGKKLIWAFQPIRWWYLYKMFAIANIVELVPRRKVTWEVTALPGFYARHTYHVQDLGGGLSRFGSWEQALGMQIRFAPTKKFWVAHFTFVKDRSLDGAQFLEGVYKREGKITKDALSKRRYWLFWLTILILLLVLTAAGVCFRFYRAYMRPVDMTLAPGVEVVTAGGGNSLIVKDGADLMVVDTKFPPGSDWLNKSIASRDGSGVTVVVNSHYHYDHTQGNTNYPGAKIYAYKSVPDLMRKRDGEWWNAHQSGIPTELVDGTRTIKVGAQDVVLTYPGKPAHTHGDLYVYVRRGDREIVATGDLVFHTYYPFMDLGEGGEDIVGLISAVRALAAKYPNAMFVPGHGPMATAPDLSRYAEYLQFVYDSVWQARQNGLSEDQAAGSIDLSRWNLSRLPSFHGGHLCWATAEMNIRWVYQIQAGTFQERKSCTF